MDNILIEYRDKLQNLKTANEIAISQNKELEFTNKLLKENELRFQGIIKDLEIDKRNLENEIYNFRETLDNEIKEKRKAEEKYKNTNKIIKTIITKIQDLFAKENKVYADNKKIFSDMAYFFKYEEDPRDQDDELNII